MHPPPPIHPLAIWAGVASIVLMRNVTVIVI